jgi:Uma2 family endonuclease
LFYVSAELEARLDPNHRTTADLVIEVVSSGSAIYDRNAKADTYGALGVTELWLVEDTREQIEVRIQTGGGFGERREFTGAERIVSKLLPDLVLLPARLFAD